MEFEDYVGTIMGTDKDNCWILREYLGEVTPNLASFFWGYCDSEGVLNSSEDGRVPELGRTWISSLEELERYYVKHADSSLNLPTNKVLRKIKAMSKRQKFKFQECS